METKTEYAVQCAYYGAPSNYHTVIILNNIDDAKERLDDYKRLSVFHGIESLRIVKVTTQREVINEPIN